LEIIKTKIEGLLIIKPRVFEDPRGYFFEPYNRENFIQNTGVETLFVQDNESFSSKNVLRGLHFQSPPKAQDKLVRVIAGSVLDVAVDIRKNSTTYGQYVSVILSAENKKQFLIPKGFAHGFLSLEDNTIFSYKCSDHYSPEHEGALRWNDPNINIDWQIDAPLVSDKDEIAGFLKDFSSPFV